MTVLSSKEKVLSKAFLEVMGDWSSAAFPIAAALITQSPLVIEGLDFADAQGDRALLSHLAMMNASLTPLPKEKKLIVEPSVLRGTILSLDGTIDTLPALAAVACLRKGRLFSKGQAVRVTKSRIGSARCTSSFRKWGLQFTSGAMTSSAEKRIKRGFSFFPCRP